LLINASIVNYKDKKGIKTYHCSRKCLFQYQVKIRNSGMNKQERKIAKILRGTKFHFVGNFKCSIGGKYPDFISKRRMKVIEFFGEHWHPKADEKKRIAHFQKYGYKCLVIWLKDLKHRYKVTKRKILQFAS
jgi:very-short-patch-repair endonuclease